MSDTIERNSQNQRMAWESIDVPKVLEEFGTSKEGLSQGEAKERLDQYGENKLPEAKKKSPFMVFLAQFHNALIYVLLVAALITGILQHWVDMGVILGVVIINSVIGFIQEGKAEKALDSIRKMMSSGATVVRDGKKKDMDATLLVPGDIVYVKPGDKIPADLRIIDSASLRVEEASLTGEAEEVMKFIEPVEEDAELGDRTSMAYMGTTVRNGSGMGVVVATALDTELGKINTMISTTQDIETPLIQKINQFGKGISVVIIVVSILVFLYGYFLRDIPWAEIFTTVIGIAVAAIPEGLPAIMTITLAIGVQKMARRNAIVRRLPSVETLGAVTVICSDKTGTLTKNEMTAVSVFTAKSVYRVEGSGYSPEGEILCQQGCDNQWSDFALNRMLESAWLCNDSEINKLDNGEWELTGAPTEGALKVLAMKGDVNKRQWMPDRVYSIPFDSNYKYMATENFIDGEYYVFVNGAPERVMELCQKQMREDQEEPLDHSFWEGKIGEGASQGQRMLGAAYIPLKAKKTHLTHEDLQGQLIFLGVFGLIDPPREEAIEAVRQCREAGIDVKMITGDHALTAMSIGKELGIGDGEVSLVGSQLEDMSDEQLREEVKTCHIFARTSPEHKLRIVKAIQENGGICAMTGDGVNDAPALKRANMGIAMGIKGTEVSKDSSDMVLVDDNFASIVHAVEEGRTIYANIRKTLLFILPTNGAEAVGIMLAIFLGFSMPITAPQILWINMITAVTLALSLAFEPMEKITMKRPPRDAKEPIISKYFAFRIFVVSIVAGIFTLLSFLYWKEQGADLEYARTVAVNTLVLCELFYLLNCRQIIQPALTKEFFGNRIVFYVILILIFFQLVFTYLPVMNFLFMSVPLDIMGWSLPLLSGLLIFAMVEIEKAIVRKLGFVKE
jgi:magnesium-transporting ATPase (P-type)